MCEIPINCSPLNLEFTTTTLLRLQTQTPVSQQTLQLHRFHLALEVAMLIASPPIGRERQSRTADGNFVNELDYFIFFIHGVKTVGVLSHSKLWRIFFFLTTKYRLFLFLG